MKPSVGEGNQDLPPGRQLPTVRLRPQHDRRLAAGHLWIYDGEIDTVRGRPQPGDLVDVFTQAGRFCGRGFFNPHSKIRVRLLTFQDEPVDEAFWDARIRTALALRQRVVSNTNAYRLVHGEGDRLPGLVVDRYGDLLVMQTFSLGMERRKELLADLLMSRTKAAAVYLRNDSKSLPLEGLTVERGFLRGRCSTKVEIFEDRARFLVDVERGQKTGWFCDQRENRSAVAALASDAEVLEAFSHTGGFGIHAALHGAGSVTGFDVGGEAVALAREHAALNGVAQRSDYYEADAFEELRALERKGRRYDLIVLDPPAFAKSKPSVPQALAGYKEINLRALKLLRPEGYLATCSCSYHVGEERFREMLVAAARDVKRQVRVIETRSQARDHPMLAAMPETRYLKCVVLQAF